MTKSLSVKMTNMTYKWQNDYCDRNCRNDKYNRNEKSDRNDRMTKIWT